MTVRDIYEKLSERIPQTLREEWDNDGLMCCADDTKEVKRALVSLDVTDEIVDYATNAGFDLIISHHPLIFKPLSSLSSDDHIGRKLINLISADISVISLHTRADKVAGGVNDCLAKKLGIKDAVPFGEGGMGRIGHLPAEINFGDFARSVKSALGADVVLTAEAYPAVYTVALLGGDGKDFVKSALEAGADTYVSGRISYNMMEEAPDLGINLIEAGHYATERPVTEFFASLIKECDSRIYVEIVDSNVIGVIA